MRDHTDNDTPVIDPPNAEVVHWRPAARCAQGNEMTPAKHAVIHGYLTQAFAGHAIEEVEDHSHLTWIFNVLLERKSPLVAFSHEFVDDSEPEEIGALLKKWRVAEFMRANPGMRVVVTTRGPTLRRRDSLPGVILRGRIPLLVLPSAACEEFHQRIEQASPAAGESCANVARIAIAASDAVTASSSGWPRPRRVRA